MMNAARLGTKYATPAAVTLLALSPSIVEAKEASKTTDVTAVKKSIAEVIEEDAEKRGDGTSLTGTFVRVS